MFRDVVKKLVLVSFYQAWRVSHGDSPTLTVLTYHRISLSPERGDPLKVSSCLFERQIRYVRNNYSIISADDLTASIRNGRPLPTNACLITFDDGWQDNFDLAFPILKRYQVPALVFLSTDYIGTGKVFWQVRLRDLLSRSAEADPSAEQVISTWPMPISGIARGFHRLSRLEQSTEVNRLIEYFKGHSLDEIEGFLPLSERAEAETCAQQGAMLSWEQVRVMAADGIAFGSHGKSHSILTQLSEAQLNDELIESKRLLEGMLQSRIDFVAYPNGDYDHRVLDVANKAGYLAAFTCRPGINETLDEPLEIRRINMREDSAAGIGRAFSPLFFSVELSGVRFRVKDVMQGRRTNRGYGVTKSRSANG